MAKPAAAPSTAAPPQVAQVVPPESAPAPGSISDAPAENEGALRARVEELTATNSGLRDELAAALRDGASMRAEIENLRQQLKGSRKTSAPALVRRRLVAIEPISPVISGERRDLQPGHEFEAALDEVAGLAEGVHFKPAG